MPQLWMKQLMGCCRCTNSARGQWELFPWGWIGPALLRDKTRGPKQMGQHHSSLLPKVTAFLGIYEIFSAPHPPGEELFPLPLEKCHILLARLLASSVQATTGTGRVSPVFAAMCGKEIQRCRRGLCAPSPCCSHGRAEVLLHLHQQDALAAFFFFF